MKPVFYFERVSVPASTFWRDDRKEAGTAGYPPLHPTGVCFTPHRALTHCRSAPPDVSRHRSPVLTCQLPHICSLAPPPVILCVLVVCLLSFGLFLSLTAFLSVCFHSLSLCSFILSIIPELSLLLCALLSLSSLTHLQ